MMKKGSMITFKKVLGILLIIYGFKFFMQNCFGGFAVLIISAYFMLKSGSRQ